LTTWNYKGQDPKTFRHYGPMAQEFYYYFGHDAMGTIGNDTTINSADIDGVMFTAIQSLIKENKQLRNKVASLTAANKALKRKSSDMEERTALREGKVRNILIALQSNPIKQEYVKAYSFNADIKEKH